MIKIDVPRSVKLIIKILEENGFEAYAVGGCVRDAVIGRVPHDWDITTSAMPEDVKRIFNKTIDTGIAHGTVTVMIEKVGYEVTTYRIDGEYEDGRHPKKVEFTGNLIEDLKRRDFTINAMAYNDRCGVVDEFDGIGDLNRGMIKCVGNPVDRFNEDALRILRAVRFAAVLDFEVEDQTRRAINELAENLNKISKERIQAELEKLLMSNHPEKIKLAYDLGITKVIFDEIDRVAGKGDLERLCKLLKDMPKEHYIRWSAVLSHTDKDRAKEILKGFKFDNKTIDVVSRIVEASKRVLPDTRGGVRKDIYEIGEDIYSKYLEFMKVFAGDRLENVLYCEKEYTDIIEKNECISMKGLAINGRDLVELGLDRGAVIGEELKRLLYIVLEDQSYNEKEKLIEQLHINNNEKS